MPNDYFEFKQFTVWQAGCSQKVSTDACIFGAWTAKYCVPKNNVLDIGAGTGLLMLMIAQEHQTEIDGIEIEEECASQMKQNIESSAWSNRLHAINADVKNYPFEKKYDLVISNPPFYENQLRSADTAKNLAWHSSELDLAELTGIAARVLLPQGNFSVIIPYSRKEEALTEGSRHDLATARVLTVRHTLNHPYTRCMIIFSKQNAELIETDLVIRNEDGSYTEEFRELLAGYYLFL
jgi:tRNA1Val (adenine37-N6)-methyltransferase